MNAYLVFLAVMTLAVAIGLPLRYGRARHGQWGFRAGAGVSTGDAPYRDVPVHDVLPVGAPAALRTAAALNGAWGMLTLLVFAPAGALFMMILSASMPVPMLLFLVVSVDGFILPFVLFAASRRLLQRDDLDAAQRAVKWSYIHHGAVFVAAVITALFMGAEGGVVLVLPTGVACAIGAGLARRFDHALRVARETPAAA